MAPTRLSLFRTATICLLWLSLTLAWLPAFGNARSAPLTVTTTVTVVGDMAMPELDIPLTGLCLDGEPSEPVLSVVWTKGYRGGWFTTWDAGLQVAPLLRRVGAEGAPPPRKDLGLMGPGTGHAYETTLSYDPYSGLVSAVVVDLTSKTRVFATNTQLLTYSGALQPCNCELSSSPASEDVGPEAPAAPLLTFSPPRVVEAFVPAGVEWSISAWDKQTQAFSLPLGHDASLLTIDRRQHKEIAVQLVHPPYPMTGRFRVTVDDGEGPREVSSASAMGNSHLLPVPTADLPIGRGQLVLEYVDEIGTWRLDSRSLRVGFLEMTMDPVAVDGDRWLGKLTLAGDGAFPDLTLRLGLRLTPVSDYGRPRNADQHTTILETEAIQSLQEPMTLEFPIPHPASDHRLWQLQFVPVLSKDVVLHFTGKEDLLLLTAKGRYVPPEITVEIEEEVYSSTPAVTVPGPCGVAAVPH
jgi:hypothetical protein